VAVATAGLCGGLGRLHKIIDFNIQAGTEHLPLSG